MESSTRGPPVESRSCDLSANCFEYDHDVDVPVGEYSERLGSPPTGLCWSPHDDAVVLARRAGPDVREVKVESEEHPRVCLACRCNFGIVPARESFVVEGVALPAGCAQELDGLDGRVLIELRAHTRKLRRKGQDSLLRQVGGIRQGRLNAR